MDKILFASVWLALMAGGNGAVQAGDAPAQPKSSSEQKAAQLIDVGEAESLIAAKKVLILDVRTPQEFAAGHLAGATNLDFHSKDFQAQLERLNKKQSYLVHCAIGGRSARAGKLMNELNFTSVYDLKGGIKAWEKAGKPIVK
jgi:rhodanese-related sulfurtransferase